MRFLVFRSSARNTSLALFHPFPGTSRGIAAARACTPDLRHGVHTPVPNAVPDRAGQAAGRGKPERRGRAALAARDIMGVLATAARLPAALVWAIIYLLRWVETRFLHPVAAFFIEDVVAVWEEGAKLLVREAFAAATRGANGATAWLLSLLVDRRYWRTLRAEGARSRRGVAWEAYWREARPSTLNAVVARAVQRGSAGEEVGGAATQGETTLERGPTVGRHAWRGSEADGAGAGMWRARAGGEERGDAGRALPLPSTFSLSSPSINSPHGHRRLPQPLTLAPRDRDLPGRSLGCPPDLPLPQPRRSGHLRRPPSGRPKTVGPGRDGPACGQPGPGRRGGRGCGRPIPGPHRPGG